MHYLFGIICFILLITSPLPAPDNEQCLQSCPRSQSLPRAAQTTAQRPQGYFTSPGKHPGFAKSFSLPCRHHRSQTLWWPASGTPAHCPTSRGSCWKQLLCNRGSLAARRNWHHTHTSPALNPSCTLSPASCCGLTAEQGNHHEFL